MSHEHDAPALDSPASQDDLMSQLKTLRHPQSGSVRIADLIDPLVRKGDLYRQREDGTVQCYACGHDCVVKPGKRGICQVRYNLQGTLYVPWGYVAALQCDPTEKKPFFHVYPGSDTLTFGMHGCDLHCSYCQNWDTSQTLRDANAGRPPQPTTAEELVRLALKHDARCVASSYNEPLITSEWAVAVFERASRAGLTCLYVSNGNATQEVLQYLRPTTSGYKIDLKSMRDRSYRKLGTVLENVLNGIRMAHDMGFWVEIVTLIIPGFNDSEEELRDAARFIHSVSPEIPWHVTAFYKNYKMHDPDDTPAATLMKAADIGYAEGLHYVYAGNQPGRVGRFENTFCPGCGEVLIERIGYVILSYSLSGSCCPHCGHRIAGIWPENAGAVRLGQPGDLFRRAPRAAR